MRVLIATTDSDIGAALRRELLRCGHTVDGTSRVAGAGQHLLDVTQPFASQMGVAGEKERYDYLFYTVAADMNDPQLTMNVNATRSFDFLRFAARHWMKPDGRVVVLGSVVGSVAETDQLTTPYYRMSKAALNMAVKMLAVEQKQLDWAVIHPGLVHTKMTKGMSFRNPAAISPEACATQIRERMVNEWPGFGFWNMTDGRRIRW